MGSGRQGAGRPGRGLPVRAHLVLLVFAVLLPVLGFAGAAVWRFAEAERARIIAGAQAAASDTAAAIEREFAEILTLARVLAASEALERGDLAEFHRRASAAADLLDGLVALRDPQSRILLASAIPWGSPLPATSLVEEDAEAARTGRPVVSRVYRGRIDPQLWFAVVLPVQMGDNGQAPHFLALSLPVARIQRILENEVTLGGAASIGVVDRSGTFVARTLNPEQAVGTPSAMLRGRDRLPGQGVLTGELREGGRILLAYHTLPESGWQVGVGVPVAVLDAPLDRALWTLAVTGSLSVATGLLAALLLGRRLDRAVMALSAAAEALRHDRPVPVLATPLSEANEVGAALSGAAATIHAREAQLRLMVNELNHRVKNTLASIQAIAAQTLRNTTDTEAARLALQSRLRALAAAHDILTRTQWQGAALDSLAADALAPLRPADPARLSLAGPPVWLPPRAALSLALAFHELATNAVKYGAFANEAGRVAVSWTVDEQAAGPLRLGIRWAETGGPPIAGPPARRGFGSRLIERSLAHDLGGSARLEFRPEGLVCIIEAVLTPADDMPVV